MDDVASVGHVLKRYRMRAGITQQELADRANVSVYTVSNLERDVIHRPRPITLDLLMDALNMHEDQRTFLLDKARQMRAMASSEDAYHETSRATSSARITISSERDGHQGEALRLLPPRPQTLFGRQNDTLALLNTLTTRQHSVVFLSGVTGVGKTALASEVLHQVWDNRFASWGYRDGIAAVSCAGVRSLRSICSLLIELADLVHPVPNSAKRLRAPMKSATSRLLDNKAAFSFAVTRFRQAYAGKSVLVLLDDFGPHIPWRQLVPVFTFSHGYDSKDVESPLFLITTQRFPLVTFGRYHRRLDPLDTSSSVELLVQRIGRLLDPDELGAARQVCEALGCLPRSLEAMAIQIASGAIVLPTLASHVYSH